MSRRTKVIIAVLFLTLAAIPLVHTILTWHATEPLRFRLAGHELVQTGNFAPHRILHLEVENTSSTKVMLIFAHLSTNNSYEVVLANREWSGFVEPPASKREQTLAGYESGEASTIIDGVVISPSSTWKGSAIIRPSNRANTDMPSEITVTYGYASSFRHRVIGWCHSFCGDWLFFLRKWLPESLDSASTPLKPAA
jgi:hypothetical protein